MASPKRQYERVLKRLSSKEEFERVSCEYITESIGKFKDICHFYDKGIKDCCSKVIGVRYIGLEGLWKSRLPFLIRRFPSFILEEAKE